MVGARAPGTEQISQRVVFLSFLTAYKKKKNVFFRRMPCGVGGVPFWPGGRGGRPRALIPGEGVREGLAWQGKVVGTPGRFREAGQGLAGGGGARASAPGG